MNRISRDAMYTYSYIENNHKKDVNKIIGISDYRTIRTLSYKINLV